MCDVLKIFCQSIRQVDPQASTSPWNFKLSSHNFLLTSSRSIQIPEYDSAGQFLDPLNLIGKLNNIFKYCNDKFLDPLNLIGNWTMYQY